jgi:hypothetical protein
MALMLAAVHGHLEAVKYLVQATKADRSKENKVSVAFSQLLCQYCYHHWPEAC